MATTTIATSRLQVLLALCFAPPPHTHNTYAACASTPTFRTPRQQHLVACAFLTHRLSPQQHGQRCAYGWSSTAASTSSPHTSSCCGCSSSRLGRCCSCCCCTRVQYSGLNATTSGTRSAMQRQIGAIWQAQGTCLASHVCWCASARRVWRPAQHCAPAADTRPHQQPFWSLHSCLVPQQCSWPCQLA